MRQSRGEKKESVSPIRRSSLSLERWGKEVPLSGAGKSLDCWGRAPVKKNFWEKEEERSKTEKRNTNKRNLADQAAGEVREQREALERNFMK